MTAFAFKIALSVLSLSHSLVVAVTDGNTPSQIHLAYAGSTGMMVSYNTVNYQNAPTVFYGTSPDQLTSSVSSSISVTYQTSTTYNNHVRITGLEPNTLYYYKPAHYNLSAPLSFRTSRAAGDHTPFTAAVVVDLGTMGPLGLTTHVGNGAANPLKPGETNTIQSLRSSLTEWDFLWHSGDIAYADYWLKEEIQNFLPNTSIAAGAKVYEEILNAFYDEMASITSLKAYMVGPGNHEANCDNGGYTDDTDHIHFNVSICMPGQTNFTGYRHHFRMPSLESGGLENFWYSWDHGMAHFIQLNTETDLGNGFRGPDEPGGVEHEDAGPFAKYMNQQVDFLKKDLAAVDRQKTPWVIVAGHRPWYINVENDESDLCHTCREAWEEILYEGGVDLVLSGHVHAYQRNAPIYKHQIDPAELDNPRFPWYITNGAAGHYDGLDTLNYPGRNFTRKAIDTVYGWSRLTFHNASHLTQEFVASGSGLVLDSATLVKLGRD